MQQLRWPSWSPARGRADGLARIAGTTADTFRSVSKSESDTVRRSGTPARLGTAGAERTIERGLMADAAGVAIAAGDTGQAESLVLGARSPADAGLIRIGGSVAKGALAVGADEAAPPISAARALRSAAVDVSLDAVLDLVGARTGAAVVPVADLAGRAVAALAALTTGAGLVVRADPDGGSIDADGARRGTVLVDGALVAEVAKAAV